MVVLSSSLLTDRMLTYGGLLPKLSQSTEVEVWSTPMTKTLGAAWGGATVRSFPHVSPGRFRNQLARRVTEFAWDARRPSVSRESFWELRREQTLPGYWRVLRAIGTGVATLHLESWAEEATRQLLLRERRSTEAASRLRMSPPDLLVTMSPFRTAEPGIVAHARRMGIPVVAFITSWDNLSTKSRFCFDYDGYLVWSTAMRDELLAFYPRARDVPVHVVGAPQFDVFRDERFLLDRADWFAHEGLDPARKLIVYSLGSPNLIREHHGAVEFADRVARGELGDVQLLVRPHPVFRAAPELDALRRFGPSVIVQDSDRTIVDRQGGMQGDVEIARWVSTFHHADVVVNLSSTVTVDAAFCDTPVVNLDFDPEPGAPNGMLVREINHRWNHFRPVAESGGVWLAPDMDAVVAGARAYLADPRLHGERRRWIVEHVCGFRDGRSGERFADAVAEAAGGRQA